MKLRPKSSRLKRVLFTSDDEEDDDNSQGKRQRRDDNAPTLKLRANEQWKLELSSLHDLRAIANMLRGFAAVVLHLDLKSKTVSVAQMDKAAIIHVEAQTEAMHMVFRPNVDPPSSIEVHMDAKRLYGQLKSAQAQHVLVMTGVGSDLDGEGIVTHVQMATFPAGQVRNCIFTESPVIHSQAQFQLLKNTKFDHFIQMPLRELQAIVDSTSRPCEEGDVQIVVKVPKGQTQKFEQWKNNQNLDASFTSHRIITIGVCDPTTQRAQKFRNIMSTIVHERKDLEDGLDTGPKPIAFVNSTKSMVDPRGDGEDGDVHALAFQQTSGYELAVNLVFDTTTFENILKKLSGRDVVIGLMDKDPMGLALFKMDLHHGHMKVIQTAKVKLDD